MEWMIVTMVVRRDAPNTDWIDICLLRESPALFQRQSGATTREISAKQSAAKTKKSEDHPSHRKYKEALTDQFQERHRWQRYARAKFAYGHLLGDQRCPHTCKGH